MKERFGQPRGARRLEFVLAALVVSGLLHVAAVLGLRHVPGGTATSWAEMRRPDLPPGLRVEEVRMAELPREIPFPEPERFVPEDPNRVANVARELDSASTPPDATPIEQDVQPSANPGDTIGKVAPTALPAMETVWQARQEILAVTEKLYADEVIAIPRQPTPDLPRASIGSDLVAPVEEVTPAAILRMADMARQAPVLAGPSTSPDRVFIPSEIPGVAPGGTPGQGAGPAAPANPNPPGPGGLLDEIPEEVGGLKPVENLLGLQVYAQTDPLNAAVRYFKIEISRAGIEALPVLPKSLVFMLDSSESMTTAKLRRFSQGVEKAIDQLNPGDTFNIITFSDAISSCFPDLEPANSTFKARARTYLQNLSARGRTDVFESLKRLTSLSGPSARPLLALLMTDGRPTMGVMDSSDIIEQFSRINETRISMFSVGGGRRVNKYLLDLLSYRNRGSALVVVEEEGLDPCVVEMGRQIRNPVLSSLTYRFTGLDEAEVYPRALTHLYLDRPLVIHGMAPSSASRVALQIVGNSGDTRHDMVFQVDLVGAPAGKSNLRLEWAWQKMYMMIGDYIKDRTPGQLEAMKRFAQYHGIEVPYTYDASSPARP